MRVFVKVAETHGFAETARQLQLSPPAVTRAVASLEAAIGTRLLTRTTRRVSLTEAGQRYLDDCRRILVDIEHAEAAAAGSFAQPAGTLSVTAPVMFGQTHVLPTLVRYLERYPAVTGRALFLDRVTNLVDEGIDVAVRIGHLPDSSHHAIRVGWVSRVVCAAPSYLAEHGTPRLPEQLASHTIVAASSSPTPAVKWRFAGDKPRTVTVHPRLYCNTIQGTLGAVQGGWGVTRVLSYQVQDAFRDGLLQPILVDFQEDALPVQIVHPEGRYAPAKVRSFIAFAVEALRQRLGDLDAERPSQG